MKSVARLVIAVLAFTAIGSVEAQRRPGAPTQPPALPNLSPEATAALQELESRYAREVGLTQGWFRDRTVLYYDFGSIPQGTGAARVIWPIHGFDARGNPVAIRGQRPIFSTIPGVEGYSGVWRLVYVVTQDNVQPNELRDLASIDEAVRRGRANIRDTELTLNMPVVPRGTTLARDTTRGLQGWYEGRDIQFFDFGSASLTPAPMWRFARGMDASGRPEILADQNSVVDSIPVASGSTYPDLWAISVVRVDSTYAPNSFKSAGAIRGGRFAVDTATTVFNLPITIIDGTPLQRMPSPVRAFADLRSPFPPAPTRP